VDKCRALRVRDAAQRSHHLIGTVFQIAQVVTAPGIVGVTGPVLVVPGQQDIGDHVCGGSPLGQHRMMNVPYARDAVERRRALG
jgi:hypothetical protein